jgi:hypothetical protein
MLRVVDVAMLEHDVKNLVEQRFPDDLWFG